MVLDGRIHNGVAGLGFVVAVLFWAIYVARRFGLVFRHQDRRDPGKGLLITPKDVLNEKEWTSAGIGVQRRFVKQSVIAAAMLLALWLALDSVF